MYIAGTIPLLADLYLSTSRVGLGAVSSQADNGFAGPARENAESGETLACENRSN
jgi:hypothetical protein